MAGSPNPTASEDGTGEKGVSIPALIAIVICIGLLGASVGSYVFAQMAYVPPADVTRREMRRLESAIEHFRLEHRRVPDALGELVGDDGVLGDVPVPTDGWRNDFLYSVTGGRSCELVSLGADGRPGGVEQEADIRRTIGEP